VGDVVGTCDDDDDGGVDSAAAGVVSPDASWVPLGVAARRCVMKFATHFTFDRLASVSPVRLGKAVNTKFSVTYYFVHMVGS
jgi:hypothetical protein